jgi:hypothetical protein
MPKYQPLIERFCAKVSFNTVTGCWLWKGYIAPNGYGYLMIKYPSGKFMPQCAHRIAYELFIGPVPEEQTVDHLCRTRKCCNPFHLEVCSNRENILRGTGWSARNAKKTHCPKGHPYEERNIITRVLKNGVSRNCRKCYLEYQRNLRLRKSTNK